MDRIYSWIYIDHIGNIWRFSQNNNKELRYSIMYSDGKSTKENLIDKDVLAFTLYVEEEIIHIIYSNIKNELKYCTMKDNQWVGKVLYQTEKENFRIYNLKVEIIEDEMHVFYLLKENDNSDHSLLMHCIWNGKETKFTPINDIIISNIKEEYKVVVDNDNNMDVIFVTDVGDEICLKHSSFQSGRWISPKRLYGIQGYDLGFQVLKNQQNIHILNKCRENSTYSLDHVLLEPSGNMSIFKIHRSKKELAEPLLFISNNKLYSCWIEKNKIFYSVFDGESWSSPGYVNRGNEYAVKKYGFYHANGKKGSFREREVYGTDELDLKLLIPSKFVMKDKKSLSVQKNQDNIKQIDLDDSQKKDIFQNLKLQISKVKSENKKLEKTISSLSIQLKKQQSFIEEYKEKNIKILEQKHKSDENCSIFMKLQKKMQNELEKIKGQLSEEIELKVNFKNKLKKCEEKNMIISQQLEKLTEENTSIKQQVKIIKEKNGNINKELELEKNKSLMQRLLKGKSSEF